MQLNPTAITDRSNDAGYPLAFHTGTHMTHDGKPYLSLLGRGDVAVADRWTFDRRVNDAFAWENQRDRYDGAQHPSCVKYVTAAARRAAGWKIEVPRGHVSIGRPHYYGDCRHIIEVHGPAGDELLAARNAGWHEVPGYATGSVNLLDSRLLSAIARAGDIDYRPFQRSGLVHVCFPDNDRIIHIGSMQRVRTPGGWSTWTLGG